MSDAYKQQVEKGYVQKNTCTLHFNVYSICVKLSLFICNI